MQSLIATTSVFIQTDFSHNAKERVERTFGMAAEERILCAVWLERLALHGFVVTDKALHWKIKAKENDKTVILSGAAKKKQNEQVSLSVGKVISDNARSPLVTKLAVTIGEKQINFYFSALAENRAAIARDVLLYALKDGIVPQIDFGAEAPTIRPRGLQAAFDKATLLLSDICRFARHMKRKIATHVNPDSTRTETAHTPEKTGGERSQSKKNAPAVKRALTYLSDFLAGLLLISTVVAILKPDLLLKVETPETHPVIISTIGLALLLYALLKTAVIFLARAPQKLVSALMVVLMLVLLVLLKYKSMTLIFLLFIVCAIVSYAAFSISCGFSARATFWKFAVLAFTAVLAYIGIHIALDYGNIQSTTKHILSELHCIGNALKIPLH